ncbi:hypothetical protein DFS34DRAFT_685723 [Phlyctochytrium arcticum]|nr:hypothetical protein DFS34DRAFT_685723 [Phlyctochytrium arcticum]
MYQCRGSGGPSEDLNIIKRNLDELTRLNQANQAKNSRIIELMQENTERLKKEKLALLQRITRSGARWTKILEDQHDTGIDSARELSRTLFQLRVVAETTDSKKSTPQLTWIFILCDLKFETLNLRQASNRSRQNARFAQLYRYTKHGMGGLERQRFNSNITRLGRELGESQLRARELEAQLEAQSAKLKWVEESWELAQETIDVLRFHLDDFLPRPRPYTVPGPEPESGIRSQYNPRHSFAKLQGTDSPYTLSRKLAELEKNNRQLRLNYGIGNIKNQQFQNKMTSLERQSAAGRAKSGISTNHILRAAMAGNDENPKSQELLNQYQEYVKILEKQLDNISELPTPTGPTNIFDLLGYRVEVKDGGVHFSSIYAVGTSYPTIFAESGEITLVGGSGKCLRQIEAMKKYYMDQLGSVPALFAGMTLAILDFSLNK